VEEKLGKLLTVEKAALEKYLQKGQTESIKILNFENNVSKKRSFKPRGRITKENKGEER